MPGPRKARQAEVRLRRNTRGVTRLLFIPAVLSVALAAGCGSSSNRTAPPPATVTTTTPTAPAKTTTAAANGPGALQAEASAAAAGDIPDNQVFLVFRTRRPATR